MSLRVVPLKLKDANEYVAAHHRHHGRVVGYRFAIGVAEDDVLVGVAIVGRPVARMLDDGFTAEVTRVTTDGTKNACSMLYAAAWRAWRAMGGHRLITYTLSDEPGSSVRGAGWREMYRTQNHPQGWNRASRPRSSGPQAPKTLWEITAKEDAG